jgi:hypothetical protein
MVKPRSKKTQRRVQKNFYADVKTAKALEDVPSNPGRTIYIVKRGGKAAGWCLPVLAVADRELKLI